MTTELFDVAERGIRMEGGDNIAQALDALAMLKSEHVGMARLNRQAICVYCGHIAESVTRETLRDVMAEHIPSCARHPINRIVEITEPLEQQIATLMDDRAALRTEVDVALTAVDALTAERDAALLKVRQSEKSQLHRLSEAEARVKRLEAALRAVLVMWDRGPCPQKLDEALSWRENDEKVRAMADAALATDAPEATR